MGPNAIIGDSYGIDLPEVQPDKNALDEEKAMARFSKSKEFKKLKEIMQARIDFYQKALPDGRAITEVDSVERANMWVVANAVIGEFNMILRAYEQAHEAVKDGRS